CSSDLPAGSGATDDANAAAARTSDAAGTQAKTTKVTVRATPAGASFFLDGEPVVPAADGTIERPSGETHKLRVEAAGFTTDERSITFDADRVLDVRLVRGGKSSVTTGAGGGGPKPAGSARPTGTKQPADPSEVLGY
ncbi:MAG: hypothetical protein JWP87_5382, partial [Labilithrix sp.]|nr:hypothetical protein [Labilithrix sp.]